MLKRILNIGFAKDEAGNANEQEAVARKIWLAGLGAYAKSMQEVTSLSEKGRCMFDELVFRGREVEAQTKERVEKTAEQTRSAMQQQLHYQVQRFTGLEVSVLQGMEEKLDRLTEVIAALEAQQAAQETADVKAEKEPAKEAVKETVKEEHADAKTAAVKRVVGKVPETPVK
ncbi:phasin family protein [Plesiomonas shigelloides]|uniref:phasin family protein n=1 Tax=Plesiomonas shigelloides TaxID=703 RepID=UPI0012621B36|nr:phasin family protein [Plesiomonas shigelloides]KAB7674675.1 hypothetical protein GBN23_13165 [Plesiomonas shigelloides]MCQ8857271.1 phasin family protein [Plesiomonas shigelloides]